MPYMGASNLRRTGNRKGARTGAEVLLESHGMMSRVWMNSYGTYWDNATLAAQPPIP